MCRHERETEKVVKSVTKTAAKYDSIGKAEFEEILRKVMQQVQRNAGVGPDAIARATDRVIEDMPKEYSQRAESERSWETTIA